MGPSIDLPSTPPHSVVIEQRLSTRSTAATPVSVLDGDDLVRARQGGLGDTLEGLPGLSSSGFGPAANRPLVRGLGGPRVRILNNGVEALDASSLSDDHAVALDPLLVQRIEVLRGPAALFYGGGALGGVVNVIDTRLPDLSLPQGLSGSAELRGGGATREQGAALSLSAVDHHRWGWHADAYGRQAQDLQSPRFSVANSAARSEGGALGAAVAWGGWRWGSSLDRHQTQYGVVSSPDVRIRLVRDQWRLQAEPQPDPQADATDRWRLQRVNANLSRYGHDELEGDGQVGTRFASRGADLRLEGQHPAAWGWRGGWGTQVQTERFQAQGEEAFVPTTRTQRQALFALEERTLAWGSRFSMGARAEQVRTASEGDSADATEARFGAAQGRQHRLFSASLGLVQPWGPHQRWSLGWSRVERAPTATELYANGLHAATGVVETGLATLRSELGQQLELSWTWQGADTHLRLGAHHTRFRRYIDLQFSPGTATPGQAPQGRYESAPARLSGLEAEGHHRWTAGAVQWEVGGQAEVLRGQRLDTDRPLGRITPYTVGAHAQAQSGPWSARLGLTHWGAQQRVPEGDTPTPGSTVWNLQLSRSGQWAGRAVVVSVQADNLSNAVSYRASALPSVRFLAPRGQRSLGLTVRVDL